MPERSPERPVTVAEIKRLFAKLRDKALPIAERYRATARINESFYAGSASQWSVLTRSNGGFRVKDAWFDRQGVPRRPVNLYTGLFQTWHSLITQDRPSVAAVAASPEPVDTYRARFAQRIIEYVGVEVDSSEMFNDAVQNAGLGGTGGLKITFCPDEDKIRWAPISVHDYLLDPNADDWRDAKWVIFEDHVDEDEAEELLEQAGVTGKKPKPEKYKNSANEELEGVPRHELWMLPTRRFPKGLYACFVDDELVEEMEYPYVVEDDSGKPQYLLPLVLMTVRKQRGSVYGHTNFSDIVDLQRDLNETNSRIIKALRNTNAHLKVPAELEGFNPAESSVIVLPKNTPPQVADSIQWTQPARVAQELFGERDYLSQAMQLVVGLNSTTTGAEGRTLSGRAIENVVDLDHDRNADCTRSMETMIKLAYKLSLALISRYYTATRQVRITDGDAQDVLEFSSADVDGVDIRLEPSTEIDQISNVKAANVRAQGGTQADLERATNDPNLGFSERIAEDVIAEYMAGKPLDVLPDDLDLDVFDDVVAKHQADAVRARDMARYIALDKLKREVAQMRSQANDANPQQPAQQPGPQTSAQQPQAQQGQ